MKNWRQAIIDVLLWNYERGTWQYDVMCGLIVAFILLTPRSFFRGDFKHIEFSQSLVQQSTARQAGMTSNPDYSQIFCSEKKSRAAAQRIVAEAVRPRSSVPDR